MFVPYGDPSPMHYRKLVLDEGEYGIGLLTNSLELGCDCLGEIAYLDGVVNDNDGTADRHAERHLPARRGPRHRLEAHRLPHRLRRSPPDAPHGHLQHRHRRQLRVRLLLVPVPGRHDRVRGQALRRDLQRRRRGRATARVRRHRRPRRLRPAPPALLQRPAGHGGRRHRQPRLRGHPDRAMPEGPGNPVGNAWRAEGSPHRGRDHGQARGRPARGPLLEDRQRERHQLPRPARRLQARCPSTRHQAVRPPRLGGRQARAVHVPPALGHRLRQGRAVRHRRLPEPVGGRRRPARLRRAGTEPHRHRRGALVHLRHQPRRPPRGLAGHAGPPDRLQAAPGRLLRRQPGPRQPPARRRPLPSRTELKSQKPNSTSSIN